ncbi:unnamed protein product [Penicillium salamii]|uniref:Glycosyltransferase family 8 protein n=1 Tax=Penicillium salamii TaxID=1612424 RepID=A0A9W4NQ91_9EURO|nr:unnamed protein product [Penicillium salamii]
MREISMPTLYTRSLISIVAALAVLLWITSHGIHKPTDIAYDDATASSHNAFATILTFKPGSESDFTNDEESYLRAARLLSFQLLRNPRTRSRNAIPFLILVTPDVPQSHRDILSREGATVVPLEGHGADSASQPQRWNILLTKLSLWKLEQYHKVAFIDVNTVLFRPLDDIFEDPATKMRTTTHPTANVPKSYIMAAPYESRKNMDTQILLSQDSSQKSHMNADFLVLHPSQGHYNYYRGLFHILEKDDSSHPEEALFNYAHRADGPMPWQTLAPVWNLKEATQSDYEQGLKSVTHHWWQPIKDNFVGDLIATSQDEMTAYLNH